MSKVPGIPVVNIVPRIDEVTILAVPFFSPSRTLVIKLIVQAFIFFIQKEQKRLAAFYQLENDLKEQIRTIHDQAIVLYPSII